MALFGKNKPGAQKHSIIEVIKYAGPNDVLIWKFPNEDFNTNTQLIVGPAQEAIFVKGGLPVGHFLPGTYTLETKNVPFLRALVGMVTGGVSPFSCEVYYVNKAISMGIDWGTDAPIHMMNPGTESPIDVTGYGDFSLRVENGQKLLEKLVGATQGYTQQEIRRYFENLMAAQVRSVITAAILHRGLSVYGIDAQLPELSADAQARVADIFEPYGLKLNHFVIARISCTGLEEIESQFAKEAKEDLRFGREQRRSRVSVDTEAEKRRKLADAQAYENSVLNISEQEKLVGRMGQTLAENPGPSVSGTAGPLLSGIGVTVTQSPALGAVDLGKALLNHRPAPSTPPAAEQKPALSFRERAENLKTLYDLGMIDEAEYRDSVQALKNEMLGKPTGGQA